MIVKITKISMVFLIALIVLIVLIAPVQSCRRLPNFGRPPEFGRFQEIAQKIAQIFCAIFKIAEKHPQKLTIATERSKKLHFFSKIT